MSTDRFDQFREEIRQELRAGLSEIIRVMDQRLGGMDQRLGGMDQRLGGIDQRLRGVDRRFDAMDQRFIDLERGLRQHIDAVSEENRRHFGVLAESLQSKLELVIEGVTMVDQKVDRLSAETREEFSKFDRRLVRVTARIPRRRPR